MTKKYMGKCAQNVLINETTEFKKNIFFYIIIEFIFSYFLLNGKINRLKNIHFSNKFIIQECE